MVTTQDLKKEIDSQKAIQNQVNQSIWDRFESISEQNESILKRIKHLELLGSTNSGRIVEAGSMQVLETVNPVTNKVIFENKFKYSDL
jgi:hypothetical protein